MPRESKKAKTARAAEGFDLLTEEYPEAHCELDFVDAFQLGVATILSAQTTDVRVNMVTPELFRRYPGAEALAKIDARRPSLVLLDLMMPEMDGFTAMQEIRKDKRFAKLPIIAVTAKAMKDDQDRCLLAGANDYLAKPIDLDRLFSLIRVWLPKVELL